LESGKYAGQGPLSSGTSIVAVTIGILSALILAIVTALVIRGRIAGKNGSAHSEDGGIEYEIETEASEPPLESEPDSVVENVPDLPEWNEREDEGFAGGGFGGPFE
jgi:hypothetical protein